MNSEALFPHETVLCGRCSTACDPADNFCRNCGLALRDDAQLPAVRQSALPVTFRPRVRAVVVKSAAFVAAGTIAELLVRRLVRNAIGRARATGPSSRAIEKTNGHAHVDEELVTETYLLRRVRTRR